MESIVQQLQALSTDSRQSVPELLRKAKIIATKLELKDFLSWINDELNGYGSSREEIPPYRFITGDPRGWNPYNGWIPVIFDNPETQKLIREMPIKQPIGELEDLYKSNATSLQVPYNPEAQNALGKALEFQTQFSLFVSKTAVAGILDSVRNIILDWTLKLEQEGILGEGLSFSSTEKEKAKEDKISVKIDNIENFLGNMGNMSDNSQITITQNNANIEEIKKLTQQINDQLGELKLQTDQKQLIISNVSEIQAEVESSAPKYPKIKELFLSIRSILEGAVGSLIAQGLISNIDKIIK